MARVGFWPSPYEGLNVGDSRTSSERVVAELIAHPMTCSDFEKRSLKKVVSSDVTDMGCPWVQGPRLPYKAIYTFTSNTSKML